MKLKTSKNNLKESSSGPFVDWETNKKARKEVLDWWADVEEWNAANGYPYYIENDTDDVSDMFTAIFDMARDLRKDAPELYKRGKAINNRYGLSQIRESADIEYNPKDRAEAALMDLKLNVSKLRSILGKSQTTYNSDLDDESKMNKLADRVGILNNYIQQALDGLGDDTNESLSEDVLKTKNFSEDIVDNLKYLAYHRTKGMTKRQEHDLQDASDALEKGDFNTAYRIIDNIYHYVNKNLSSSVYNDLGDIFDAMKKFADSSLTEDTVKQNKKWVNKGKEGTHGKFRTKKAADAQRKAMFANGYKEGLKEARIKRIEYDDEYITEIDPEEFKYLVIDAIDWLKQDSSFKDYKWGDWHISYEGVLEACTMALNNLGFAVDESEVKHAYGIGNNNQYPFYCREDAGKTQVYAGYIYITVGVYGGYYIGLETLDDKEYCSMRIQGDWDKKETLKEDYSDECWAVFIKDQDTGKVYCDGCYDSRGMAGYWAAIDVNDYRTIYNKNFKLDRIEKVPEYSSDLFNSNNELIAYLLGKSLSESSNKKNRYAKLKEASTKPLTAKDKADIKNKLNTTDDSELITAYVASKGDKKKDTNQTSFTESADGKANDATDIVKLIDKKFPELEFVDERDLDNNQVGLIFEGASNVDQVDLGIYLDGLYVWYKIKGDKLLIKADEDANYLEEDNNSFYDPYVTIDAEYEEEDF